MRRAWGCCLLVTAALVGCGDDDALVADDRESGAVTTDAPSPDVDTSDGVAITYQHRADTFVYARRGQDTAFVTDTGTTIDLAGKDRIACEPRDDAWQCVSFGEDSALNLADPGGRTFENLLDLLPAANELPQARTVTGRSARCGDIQPSDELLLAITLFAGTDVNRGADDIEPTSLCVDEESDLLLSLRTPVPGKDGVVEITTTDVRPATDEHFAPPAVVQQAPHVDIDDLELDEECCDGS